MNVIQKRSAWAAGATLAVMLAGCGSHDSGCGSNPTDPSCRPSPSPSTVTTRPPFVLDHGEGTLPARFVLIRPVATTETGTFDVTVDWTFAANDIDVYLARGTCSFDQIVADQCAIAAASESTTAKPEKIRLANQPAGTYTLIVGNVGPGQESIAYQVVFTPGTTSAGAPAGSASSHVVGTRSPKANFVGAVLGSN
jgi:hypothetical protein